ncbi:MAG: type II toxin-antitoxin system RelE/ParE family toxin [Rhizobiales bacterium]|nr:type II toxin-antitoxin system RelE/ParE family toxin [Hyphomicrobiales bacterium]MBI3674447.1 type II toxin-antitoxin system RelE/ParE family toxin [Hyphomicrobiales bacterium]
MKLRWSMRARRELKQIRSYISRRDPQAADHVVARILAATRRVEQYPNIGQASDRAGVRLLQITGLPYVLPYKVTANDIEIFAVFDQRRDPEELF